ncbi:hypothetical protein RCL_jg9966.t1 [Rhizophagus clarus]|uniref:Uncharacterized protein n=1 Tax=Rhizophagus clarus TaxID=94130 RepID=A0A8H3KUS7_9GLOM|nr:hypothetical protein RCL_jg9966.t1 [Rhizophagus clarus]
MELHFILDAWNSDFGKEVFQFSAVPSYIWSWVFERADLRLLSTLIECRFKIFFRIPKPSKLAQFWTINRMPVFQEPDSNLKIPEFRKCFDSWINEVVVLRLL